MSDNPAFDYVHGNEGFRSHSLKEILTEMGFNDNDYLHVDDSHKVRVAVNRDQSGRLVEDPSRSFGGIDHNTGKSNCGTIEEQIKATQRENGNNEIPTGYFGRNNGVYAAMCSGSKDMIVTTDPRVIVALEKQFGFKDVGMDVPLSIGDEQIMDARDAEKWREVKANGERVVNSISKGEKVQTPKNIISDIRVQHQKNVQTRQIMEQKRRMGRL